MPLPQMRLSQPPERWLLQGRIHSCEAIGLQPAIARCSCGQGARRSFRSRYIRTCYGTHADLSSRTTGRTHVRCNIISAAKTFSTVRYTELSPGRFKSFGRTEEA
jgi:hypothetical protein